MERSTLVATKAGLGPVQRAHPPERWGTTTGHVPQNYSSTKRNRNLATESNGSRKGPVATLVS